MAGVPDRRSARQPARVRAGTRRTYSARARRRGAGRVDGGNRQRFVAVRIILVLVLAAAGVKLVHLQAFEAAALSAQAERQRVTSIEIPAPRGSIVDRNGAKLAFSVEVRSLSVSLRSMRRTWTEYARQHPESGQDFRTRAADAAAFIAEKLPGKVTEAELLSKFHKPADFTYLVHEVEPSVAKEITERFPEIGTENRARREYPGGSLAAQVVGVANWRMEDPDPYKHNLHGLSGLEFVRDGDLSGTPGRRLADTKQGNDNVIIPGTERELQPAVPGSDLELTIDSDVQYVVQNMLSDYVRGARARGGSAVVMDARTAEVYALATDETFDPNGPLDPKKLTNEAVTNAFEPGSVNKVVTAAAALETGVATPESVLEVPDSLQVADHVVHDAWEHPTQPFTVTGIFAKSSNIGTLLLARQVGEERFAEMLKRFGLGTRTGIGLPGESPGSVPPRDQWYATTFGNLPIGQGLSMTVLQMTSMYQAIANHGLRVEPRIVRAKITPDGRRVEEPTPGTGQVVSPQTADTVRNMLRAVTQKEGGNNNGTAPAAALEGYQISGKTGTGQQVDPRTRKYSDSLYNITFAGILPADAPRFVVGIRLDAPEDTLPQGSTAAPLFHDIASYLAQRFQLPLSESPTPVVPLVLS
ncbi:cell division protein FtsI (penicillin-binding protein 3) [Amycolatopsis arida]|uniref:Cell division protein FtsI (Penicillin-binding protein 3) n=1 Tax=Amycolatopsis arida TaxID=587909 RepID=A0A1I5VJH1_9PSEU|nr:penicillin-binding protein 2 [Amycolatopsis arida]TDX87894.1 cell division protein FtsI (penicillin-binding protein 3) [Amycolatopsis arida]SFQ07136.1 cell division protein FtsI (penicillin-binding protein 3) [Amycolatopsis arida]